MEITTFQQFVEFHLGGILIGANRTVIKYVLGAHIDDQWTNDKIKLADSFERRKITLKLVHELQTRPVLPTQWYEDQYVHQLENFVNDCIGQRERPNRGDFFQVWMDLSVRLGLPPLLLLQRALKHTEVMLPRLIANLSGMSDAVVASRKDLRKYTSNIIERCWIEPEIEEKARLVTHSQEVIENAPLWKNKVNIRYNILMGTDEIIAICSRIQ